MVNLDRWAGERARELMLGGHPGLKPPDAAHVATAALANVDEMHTFDDRLLNLTGQVLKADGSLLKICKPDAGLPIPLFAPASAPLLDDAVDDEENKVDSSKKLGPDAEVAPEGAPIDPPATALVASPVTDEPPSESPVANAPPPQTMPAEKAAPTASVTPGGSTVG